MVRNISMGLVDPLILIPLDMDSLGCLGSRSTCDEIKNTTHKIEEGNSIIHVSING